MFNLFFLFFFAYPIPQCQNLIPPKLTATKLNPTSSSSASEKPLANSVSMKIPFLAGQPDITG